MKTVFTNSALVHKFNERSQYEGRSGTMFFNGDQIYSYGRHYLLGEFINPQTIIINDKGYSSTTSKHIWLLRDATRDKQQILVTSSCLNYVFESIRENYLKLAKARKPEIYYNKISRLYNGFKKSIEALEGRFLWKSENAHFHLTPVNDANNLQKEKLEYIEKTFQDLGSPEQKEQLNEIKEAAKRKQQERIAKFYSYDVDNVMGLSRDLLRISKCGEFVETSQRVKIDINEARRFYRLIKAGESIRGKRIGNYTALSFKKLLKVGCHRISKKEVQTIGNKILS